MFSEQLLPACRLQALLEEQKADHNELLTAKQAEFDDALAQIQVELR